MLTLPPTYPIEDPEAFVGVYGHYLYGEVAVKARATAVLELHYGEMVFPMHLTRLENDVRVFTTEIETIEWMLTPISIHIYVDQTGTAVSMEWPYLSIDGNPVTLHRLGSGQAVKACVRSSDVGNFGNRSNCLKVVIIVMLIAVLSF